MKDLILNWIKTFYNVSSQSQLIDLLQSDNYFWDRLAWTSALLVATVLVSLIIWWITKEILLGFLKSFAAKTRTNFDDLLVKNKFFDAFAHLLPLMFLDYFFSIVFFASDSWYEFAERINEVLIAFAVLVALRRFLNTVRDVLQERPSLEGKPIGAYVQTVKITVSIVMVIIMLSLISGQSPRFFLTSLGAMTAILLLVFKDTILGLVGSIQMAANDMVRLGDWVSMEKYGADGDVIEINLTTVKVQNWDKTITTIPTYSFISDSFKNWRGMSEAGGRRIMRSIAIKVDSVKFATPELLAKLSKIPALAEFIEQRQKEIKAYNEKHNLDETQINARRQTNIGLFRRYLDYYLKHHERIHQDMTIMVRQLSPTENGVPMQIYCFTNTTAWVEYEGISSDIFDHIFAIIKEFDLAIHENPSGSDFQALLTKS